MTALSAWNAGKRMRAMTVTDDKIERLAIALGTIRSVVRVIDSHRPPMEVDWATTDKSYTDFAGNRIRLNPAAILDPDTSVADALDVSISFGMHEAGHSEESRDIFHTLVETLPDGTQDFALHPVRVAAYLWNVVEDVRMEREVARKWRGFAPYFDKLVYWLWGNLEKRNKIPTKYGDTLEERMTFAFTVCRFPDQAESMFDSKGRASAMFGPRKDARREYKWWSEWQRCYIDAVNSPKESLEMALEHLIEDSPEAQKEMEKLMVEEQAMKDAYSNLLSALRQLLNLPFGDLPDACTGSAGEPEDQALDEEVAAEVGQLVRENLTETPSPVATRGREASTILARKPEETPDSQGAFVGRPDAQSEALRAALVFRASDPEWTEKLLKSGEIDDEELYRWGAGDYRVFSNKVVESKPDALMGLLVDMSGSMAGSKLRIAQRLAQLFIYALHDQPGVETYVWGHTADGQSGYGTTQLYTLWEPGDPMSRLGLIPVLPHGNNADGHAIAYCADRMRDAIQPQKVLFVLSDGRPSAYEYGHTDGMAHVADACAWARSHGVEVIQIAIDPGALRHADQERMFGQGGWIGYESEQALPRQLASLMGRFA